MSVNRTQNLPVRLATLRWLSSGERDTRKREWFDFGDSDEEEKDEGSDGKKNSPEQYVEDWLSGLSDTQEVEEHASCPSSPS
jgi:hypothetical protein